MSDQEEDERPIPKGTYNFNFDDLDEFSDPFKPKKGLMNSPDNEAANPFQTKPKMASSPPLPTHMPNNKKDLNPFQTKAKLGSSPPGHTPSVPDDTPSVPDDTPSVPDDTPSVPEDTQSVPDDTPSVPEDIQSVPDDTQSVPDDTPSVPEDTPNVPGDNQSVQENTQCVPDDYLSVPDDTQSVQDETPSVPAEETVASESNNVLDDSSDSFKTAVDESPVKQKGLKTRAKSQTPPSQAEAENQVVEDSPADKASDEGAPAIQEPAKSPPKKKSTSPKKPKSGLKKPKARTKFKPPPNFGVQDSEDVVIFAPPPEKAGAGGDNIEACPADLPPPPDQQELQALAGHGGDAGDRLGEPFNGDSVPEVTNQVPPGMEGVNFMMDSVHDFGAADMPIENNEAFVPPSEGFPNVVGAVDGTHVKIQAPSTDENDYVNRKGYHSINVQMICDSTFRVVDVVAKWPGSVHDARIFRESDICARFERAFSEDTSAWEMPHEDHVAVGRESPCTYDGLAEEQVPNKATVRRTSQPNLDENGFEDEEPTLMNTPPPQQRAPGRGVARNPAARALQEQVDGSVPQKEAHVIDQGLYSQRGGDEIKRHGEGGEEKYFDALEYPLSGSRKAHMQGESEVERMNTANKKHGGAGDTNQDNIVQLVQVLKYSQSDWNKMKQELELEFNARLLNKEREWSKKLADRDKKIAYLDEQVLLLRSANEDMKCVVTEFEKTISQLQADKEKKTTENLNSFEDVVKERDQALEDLQSVETAFSDLHQRYERTKGVVEGFKKNEDVLKKCVQDYQGKLKVAEEKTMSVRNQAEDKLHQASEEMEKLRKATTSEVARLEAALKKSELKIQGLERNLDQKVKENDELTAICDELIAKVGGE